jgi:signal-transduction protein with cAMP-binding, CBS, and nucleotidyltransferase domain
MTAEQVGILLDLSDERIYRDRDPVIRITETNPDLFIVAEGGVEVRTATGDVLATMGQGSVFGEVSIVDEMPASATVLSQGMTRLNVIHRKTLHAHHGRPYGRLITPSRRSIRPHHPNARLNLDI